MDLPSLAGGSSKHIRASKDSKIDEIAFNSADSHRENILITQCSDDFMQIGSITPFEEVFKDGVMSLRKMASTPSNITEKVFLKNKDSGIKARNIFSEKIDFALVYSNP